MQSKFKELLIELGNLAKSAKSSVFRRAQIIVMLVKDKDGWSNLSAEDEGQVRQKLQRFIDELGFSVDDLMVMIDFEPNAEVWQTKRLRDIRDEAYANRVQHGQPDRPKKSQPLVDALRKQLSEARELIGSMKQQHRKEVNALKQENRQLKHRLRIVEKAIGK